MLKWNGGGQPDRWSKGCWGGEWMKRHSGNEALPHRKGVCEPPKDGTKQEASFLHATKSMSHQADPPCHSSATWL